MSYRVQSPIRQHAKERNAQNITSSHGLFTFCHTQISNMRKSPKLKTTPKIKMTPRMKMTSKMKTNPKMKTTPKMKKTTKNNEEDSKMKTTLKIKIFFDITYPSNKQEFFFLIVTLGTGFSLHVLTIKIDIGHKWHNTLQDIFLILSVYSRLNLFNPWKQ